MRRRPRLQDLSRRPVRAGVVAPGGSDCGAVGAGELDRIGLLAPVAEAVAG